MRRCDLGLEVLRAGPRAAGRSRLESVSGMVAHAPGDVLAAVNGDFFTPRGRALGTEIMDGKVAVAHQGPVLAWRSGSAPWIGTARVRGDTLDLGWPVPIDGGDGATQALGGFPTLLAEGRPAEGLDSAERPSFAARHPRTAVAYDPRAGRIWLFVVDGRQAPYSVGMTLAEVARLARSFGALEALNLDGGSSSVMVVDGRVRSRPSDPDGERPVADALAVVRDPSGCPPPSDPGLR